MRKTTIYLNPYKTYRIYTGDTRSFAIHWRIEGIPKEEIQVLFFHPKEKVSFKAKGGEK